jgi:hypothetical protein
MAVIGHVCGLCFYVEYAPCVAPMAWTMLPLLHYACFYGLDYAGLPWSGLCVCL